MSAVGFRRMMGRLGKAAKMPFPIHPHMLRHAAGFKLANQGVDTPIPFYRKTERTADSARQVGSLSPSSTCRIICKASFLRTPSLSLN
jgi:integrase